jgi:oxygen-dependent protoporphyrinogen oxidase
MIAVVGGGITGLVLGWELQRRGADFVVLEAAPRAGGVIRSARVDGRVLEWGPQRTRLTAGLRELVEALELEGEALVAPSGLALFVYRKGKLRRVPFSPAAFLRSDIVGPLAKLRLLLEPLTAGADPDERVARFFTRKVGREIYEALVAPLYGGLYASDPADMVVRLSLGHVLREFGIRRSLLVPLLRRGGRISPPAPLSFKEGMQTLTDALGRALGDRLRVATPVRGLRRAAVAAGRSTPGAPAVAEGTGASEDLSTAGGTGGIEAPAGSISGSGPWILELDDGTVEADAVVLTAPAPATAALLDPVAPAAATSLRRLRYNPLGVVHLDAETPLTGLGFQVAFTEKEMALRGVTYNHAMFGRHNVYTAYLGGARHPEAVHLDDDALARLAMDEFRLCTGYDSRPLAVEREEMPAWDASWSALEGFRLPDGLHVAANWMGRPGIPGRLAEARRTAARLAGRGVEGR